MVKTRLSACDIGARGSQGLQGAHKHIGEVDGDLIVNDATVRAEPPGGVIKVKGVTECKDDCRFESSFETTARGLGSQGYANLLYKRSSQTLSQKKRGVWVLV